MEITDDKVQDEIDSMLRTFQVTENYDIKDTAVRYPDRSMSFLSCGGLAYFMLCTLKEGIRCCVLKTREKYFQVSVYADETYFKGTVLRCVLHETPTALIMDVFDVLLLGGQSKRGLAFPLRFENLLDCVNSVKKKNLSGNISVYDHKNAVLNTTIDIVNMFTDFCKIQKEYRRRLVDKKEVMGTIDCETGKFMFHSLGE
jgi:hypothetical protein